MIFKCPGAKNFRQPEPKIIKCPLCSSEAEIWSDEIKATCPACKKTFIWKGEQSCLDWCKFTKKCVGEKTYNKYLINKKQNLK